MTKKRFNRDYFARYEDKMNRINTILGYDSLIMVLDKKAVKVLEYLANPPRHAELPNGNIVVKPFHGVKITFVAK